VHFTQGRAYNENVPVEVLVSNPEGHSPRWWGQHPEKLPLPVQKAVSPNPEEPLWLRVLSALWRFGLRVCMAVWHSIVWLLWDKLWGWNPVSWLVGTIFIPVGIVLAQEGLYTDGRIFIVVGAVLLFGKLVHDAINEKPEKSLTDVISISIVSGLSIAFFAWFVWGVIDRIEWNHEMVVKMTFKGSPLFTPARKEKVQRIMNDYYKYLRSIGFDLPTEIPPLGLTPKGSIMLGGGSQGPAYYSSLRIPEDTVDSADTLRFIYSSYAFNRMLVWPDAYKTGLSRVEAEGDEKGAWIFECYFPSSFAGKDICERTTPGHEWFDVAWEVRKKYGKDYTDGLMAYTAIMWGGVPAKYTDNFDKFFRYKLASGESVKDNGDEGSTITAIAKAHGRDLTPPW
jgi:hypothetical protein